jgi:hypothetical protein
VKGATPWYVWAAVGLLGVVSAVVWDGSEEARTFPSATSTRHSGTAGLARLLRAEGFPVRIEASSRLRARSGEVVVAFRVVEPAPPADLLFEEGPGESDWLGASAAALERAATQGATVVVGSLGASPLEQTASLATSELQSDVPARSVVRIPVGAVPEFDDKLATGNAPYTWWRPSSGQGVEVRMTGAGRTVLVPDALSATNRYLSEDDSARFWVELLSALGGRQNGVVFADAVAGNDQTPGLLGEMGPWAVAAQWQGLFAFLLFALWAGQRLGGILDPPVRQRTVGGTTEALARVLGSGGQYGTACRLIGAERLTAFRRALRLSPTQDAGEVVSRLPTEVAGRLRELLGSPDRLGAAEALERVRALDSAAYDARIEGGRQ